MADIPLLTGMWSRLNLSPKTCAVFDVCPLLSLFPKVVSVYSYLFNKPALLAFYL